MVSKREVISLGLCTGCTIGCVVTLESTPSTYCSSSMMKWIGCNGGGSGGGTVERRLGTETAVAAKFLTNFYVFLTFFLRYFSDIFADVSILIGVLCTPSELKKLNFVVIFLTETSLSCCRSKKRFQKNADLPNRRRNSTIFITTPFQQLEPHSFQENWDFTAQISEKKK